MHKDRCLCEQIPRLETKTRVCLVIHEKELKRTTNTGRLALHSLANSELRIRGEKNKTLDLSDLLESSYQPLFLFPSEEAIELSSSFVQTLTQPALLIVPDGNWRQASKVQLRHKELANVPRITLKRSEPTSKAVLRTESVENGMATLEAIAHALALLENPETGEALNKLYQLKLLQTLLGRGVAI